VLLEACEKLREERGDFEVVVTMPQDSVRGGFREGGGLGGAQGDGGAVCGGGYRAWCRACGTSRFGLVAVEAMASGRPVCASRVGGLQDIVVHHGDGLSLRSRRQRGAGEAVVALAGQSAMRAQMGAAGRRRVEAEYAWDVVDREVLRATDRVVEGIVIHWFALMDTDGNGESREVRLW
jgi:hypothetical protein